MVKIGDTYLQKIIATDLVVRQIAEVSGDKNPIHLDDNYAGKTKFKGRIAQGLFCVNAISMILGNYLPGNGTILLSQSFVYRHPIYIDDEIEVKVIVREIIEEKKIVIIETVCKNQEGKIVVEGESKVKIEFANEC